MKIIAINQENAACVAELVADFRVELKSYKGIDSKPNLEAGREELLEYIGAGFPCYAAVEGDEYIGYIVCRIDEPCVWVESIYTTPKSRRSGVASALLKKAEALADVRGEDTAFNWVHPNNHGMIGFLRRHGYTVLNLIEIRKPFKGEHPTQTIKVGDNEFDY